MVVEVGAASMHRAGRMPALSNMARRDGKDATRTRAFEDGGVVGVADEERLGELFAGVRVGLGAATFEVEVQEARMSGSSGFQVEVMMERLSRCRR